MQLYVGTYHKYNCGSLEGEWLNLDDYSDKKEFFRACHELHKDEEDPEFMFQDFETESQWEREMYDESYISKDYWEIKVELENLGVADEVFSAWASIHSEKICVVSVSKCQEQYQGHWESIADYVQGYYEETGDIKQVPETLRGYIDFEAIARDWELNRYITMNEGFVFTN